MRQHLTAVEAACSVSNAEVTGATLGAREIEFTPGETTGGTYSFSVGTAGSATLVLQTVLPALLTAPNPSRLFLEGGTHNPLSPPFEFLERVYFPLVERMGPVVRPVLERRGFYPAGGGRFRVTVEPSPLSSFDLLERGQVASTYARALIASLPRSIAERELGVVAERLKWPGTALAVEEIRDSLGPGNALLLEIRSEHAIEIVSAFGERGLSAETVAARAVDEARAYLEAEVPVGIHLADQLLLLLALGGGGSFRTLEPTRHSRTQASILAKFLPVITRFERESDRVWLASVRPTGGRTELQSNRAHSTPMETTE